MFGTGSTLDVIINQKQTRLSDQALIAQPHSGDGRRVAAVGNKIFVVWAERIPYGNGTPCWIAELNTEGVEIDKKMLGFANQGNLIDKRTPHDPDVHDQPQLILDNDNNIHILLGAHHGTLLHTKMRSSELGLNKGWGYWKKIGQKPQIAWRGYTYPAAIWYENDLHIVTRWTGDGDPYQWKLVHFSLNDQKHNEIVALEEPFGGGYAKFEQRLFIENETLLCSYQTFIGESGRDAKPVEEKKS